jgi:hypothetical protein
LCLQTAFTGDSRHFPAKGGKLVTPPFCLGHSAAQTGHMPLTGYDLTRQPVLRGSQDCAKEAWSLQSHDAGNLRSLGLVDVKGWREQPLLHHELRQDRLDLNLQSFQTNKRKVHGHHLQSHLPFRVTLFTVLFREQKVPKGSEAGVAEGVTQAKEAPCTFYSPPIHPQTPCEVSSLFFYYSVAPIWRALATKAVFVGCQATSWCKRVGGTSRKCMTVEPTPP